MVRILSSPDCRDRVNPFLTAMVTLYSDGTNPGLLGIFGAYDGALIPVGFIHFPYQGPELVVSLWGDGQFEVRTSLSFNILGDCV